MRQLVPFLACGDLDGWDAEASYDLPAEGYVSLPPVQPPTAPAYRRAIERMKGAAPAREDSGDGSHVAVMATAAGAAAASAVLHELP